MVMSILGWLKRAIAPAIVIAPPPPSFGYPEPMLVGQLQVLLEAYTPKKRTDGNAPEHTPVKVERGTDQAGVSEIFDLAYVGYNPNTEQIELTLRTPGV